jgi:hypothetical protein
MDNWPHNTDYIRRCCACGRTFTGPKRAPSCWRCTPDQTRALWLAKHGTPAEHASSASVPPLASGEGATYRNIKRNV